MKDKRRERRPATRLMDIKNERMRWMCTAGSKEKEGERDGSRKVRGQSRERRMEGRNREGDTWQ